MIDGTHLYGPREGGMGVKERERERERESMFV